VVAVAERRLLRLRPLPKNASTGPQAKLPPPESDFLPTISSPPAQGWALSGYVLDLEHPHTLHALPNDDELVTQTNARSNTMPAADSSAGYRSR